VQIVGIKNIEIGKFVTISDDSWININNRKCIEVKIGNNSFIGRNNFFTSGKEIIIGEYFFSSKNCSFIGASHRSDAIVPYFSAPVDFSKSIRIGTNVFIGANSSIIGNIIIGHGCIIGANSVVTKNVPPFCMVAGNPAKIIKYYSFSNGKWMKGERPDEDSFISEEEYKKILEKNFISLPDASFARTIKQGWL
jgi:acetyltransferase-like isoleucine patch superfamily enzyme